MEISGKRNIHPEMELLWKRNLVMLWIGVFFCAAAYTITVPFLPIFLQDNLGIKHGLKAWSGIAFATSFLFSAIVSPFWGSLADKYGRKPMLIRSGFSLSAVYFATFFVHDPYMFLVVRVFQGLLAGFVPAAMALVATNTPDKEVGYSLGVMSTATAAGSIIGPLIGGVLSQWIGNRESFIVSGGVVLIAAFIGLFGVKETNFKRSSARMNIIADLKLAVNNRRLIGVLGITMLVSSSVMVLEPLISIYVLEMEGASIHAALNTGIIFSAVGIATIIMGPRWGKLGQKLGYSKTLIIGLIGGGIGNLLQLGTHHTLSFGILRFVYGLFFAAVYPALNSLIVQVTETDFRGRAFSLNQSANMLGMMIGPLAGGFLGEWLGIPAIFVLNGVALIAVAYMYKLNLQNQSILARALK